MKKSSIIQIISGMLTIVGYVLQFDFFSRIENNNVILEFLFILLFLFVISYASYYFVGIIITVCKIVYCQVNHLKIRTITIFPFVIEKYPFTIHFAHSFDIVIADLTNIQYVVTGKDDELKYNIKMFEIPFNEVRKYSLVIIMIISCILCLLRLYAFAFPFLGLGLSEYYLSKFDNLYTGIDNIVPTLNSDISLLRTALKHAQIESFDKEKLYQRGLSITPTTNWAYFYYQDLVVEAIIDSIIDNKEYIKKSEYTKYLSVNIFMIDELKPDTMKILRYFYLYNYIFQEKAAMEVVKDDMIFQQNKAYELEGPLSYMNIKLGNRWIDEINNSDFHFLADEKYSTSLNFHSFKQKRIKLEKLVRSFLESSMKVI